MLLENSPVRKEKKFIEAEARRKEYAKLSIEQKLKLLDKTLGVGLGAKKQRAKLAKALSLVKVNPKKV